MSPANLAKKTVRSSWCGWSLLLVAMIITGAVYNTGLSGAYLFDDYPNIVDNHGVQPAHANLPNLVGAALASPASEFKRPLASLSFAANYLASGLDPYWMKLTNLVIHLLNGLLVFLLAKSLLKTSAEVNLAKNSGCARVSTAVIDEGATENTHAAPTGNETPPINPNSQGLSKHEYVVAALIAASWMLLPINLTGVLYVVQRMESMANVFVLLGLIGYIAGRQRMMDARKHPTYGHSVNRGWKTLFDRSFILCLISITVPAALGILAKETAAMLPLYALLVEWALFDFKTSAHEENLAQPQPRSDPRIIGMFLLILLLPMVLGLTWLLPGILKPETWAVRNFTLETRLLSETRIVTDYMIWTVLPTPHALSFYHDDFSVSTELLKPWTTLASIVFLALLLAFTIWLRPRRPLMALGLAFFLGCQLLTATIIPLELIYEHRNYFASFGLMLALIHWLAAPPKRPAKHATLSQSEAVSTALMDEFGNARDSLPMALPRYVLLGGLMLCWASLTAMTAYAWGNPLRLAEDLAARAPLSPRAQYELGRTYIIYSHYDPASPFTKLAYGPLEKATALPDSSILAEQALIFMNARMHRPLKDAWWKSMIAKLKSRKPTVQDESSLSALTRCANEYSCDLPSRYMVSAFTAALSHPDPSARLFATYGDYAWNVLGDHALGLRMTQYAVKAEPHEPAYQITLVRMLAADKQPEQARRALEALQNLNYGGQLNDSIKDLRARPGMQ